MAWCCMKKYDVFGNCLDVLMSANKDMVATDEIYRMGMIGQFHLTFELAWKAIKERLDAHGVELLVPGSPREVIKKGFALGLVEDEDLWLEMLKKRNLSIHVYDEDAAERLVKDIFEKYRDAFVRLRDKLRED